MVDFFLEAFTHTGNSCKLNCILLFRGNNKGVQTWSKCLVRLALLNNLAGFFFDKNLTFLQKKKNPSVALNLVPDRNKEKCGTSWRNIYFKLEGIFRTYY